MKNVSLYVPKIKDFWFRQRCMQDPETMNYNAGYDICFSGYHYDTGCIDFPESEWQKFEEKLKNPNFFYAYIVDEKTKEFVGYLNFNKRDDGSATMGIVIFSKFRGQGFMRPAIGALFEKAKEKGVKVLTDTVPASRENALKVFFDFGFKKVDEFKSKKFNDNETVFQIEKTL